MLRSMSILPTNSYWVLITSWPEKDLTPWSHFIHYFLESCLITSMARGTGSLWERLWDEDLYAKDMGWGAGMCFWVQHLLRKEKQYQAEAQVNCNTVLHQRPHSVIQEVLEMRMAIHSHSKCRQWCGAFVISSAVSHWMHATPGKGVQTWMR